MSPSAELNLPSELIIKIFCRFKAVSKSIYILILHPRFKRRHLLCCNYSHVTRIDLQASLKPKSPPFTEPIIVPSPLTDTENVTNYYGPSNGLFYIGDFNHYYKHIIISNPNHGLSVEFEDTYGECFIWNPSTGEKLELSDPICQHSPHDYMFLPQRHEICFQSPLTGFGYVESIDDYIFVRIFSKTFLHYYSLSRRTWSVVRDNLNYNLDYELNTLGDDGGVPINGRIHWGGGHGVIVAFNLSNFKFETLAIPSAYHSSTHQCQCRVIVYHVEQYLCVAIDVDGHCGYWIMKEYGVQESWTRIWNDQQPYLSRCSPISVWDNDEVVFTDWEGRVFCCDRDVNVSKEFVFDYQINDGMLFSYVESPVSPVFFNSPLCLTSRKLVDPKEIFGGFGD